MKIIAGGREYRLNKGLIVLWLCLMAGLMIITSCGREQESTQADKYEGWSKYTYGHFIIHFSPVSRFAADKAGFARSFERFLTEICSMLEMPVPEGQIDLYVYANPSEARKITGKEPPFSDGSTIHWAGLHSYGYQLTKYLMTKKGGYPGRHNVINEGLAFLLDFSGANYHDRTNRLVNSNTLAGLMELGDNAVFDSLPIYIRRSESASLTGYIMYEYGLDRMTMLNASLTDWSESIEALFHMNVDQFEKSWLKFAREQSDDSTGTVETDTTQHLRIEIDGKQ